MYRLLRILLLSLLLPVGASAAAVCPPDSIERARAVDYFFLQAHSMIEQQKYDAAYDILEHCRFLQPESSAIQYDLANLYYFLGRREKTIEILREIVTDNPHNHQFWQHYVYALDREGMVEELLAAYEEMLTLFPEKSENYINLASRYTERGDYAKSIAVLERYEAVEGAGEIVTMMKHHNYVMMGDKAAAISSVESLIAENPASDQYLSLLGDTYGIFGDEAQAIAVHSKVLAETPDSYSSLLTMTNHSRETKNDSLYTLYAERLFKSEKCPDESRAEELKEYVNYKDSREEVQSVLSLLDELVDIPHAFNAASLVFMAYTRYRALPEEQARGTLEKILRLEPDNKGAHLFLLQYAVARNDYNEIISHCDAALMYYPDMLTLYFYRGLSCDQLGRKKEAIETYLNGVTKCSDSADTDALSDIYALLGDTYHELGQKDKSMCAYDSALVYNANNTGVLNNYAYYLALDNRELEKALDMSARTLRMEPDEPIYIDTYAWILFLLERYDEAAEYADKLMQMEAERSAVEYHHCGDIYAKTGDIERALECWQTAFEKGDDSKILKRKIKKKQYIPDGKKK